MSVAQDQGINTTYDGRLYKNLPEAGYHPCWSGLQVQGTANSPAGMVLFHILYKFDTVVCRVPYKLPYHYIIAFQKNQWEYKFFYNIFY